MLAGSPQQPPRGGRLVLALATLAVLGPAVAPARAAEPAPPARHVVFDNAPAGAPYYQSEATSVKPSRLEAPAGKLPAEAARWVSPPNALRLAWTSAPGGDWRAVVRTGQHYDNRPPFAGDVFTMRVYSEEGLEPDAAPRLALTSPRGATPTIPLLSLHGALPRGAWVRLEFPLTAFEGLFQGTTDSGFDLRRLESVTLVQGLDDGAPHTLLLDDLRVVEAAQLEDHEPPAAPERLEAEAYERHVDLAWKPGAGERPLAYRVYRSADGKAFEPVATRPAGFLRAADFVGGPGETVWHRVTALDANDNESAPSRAVESRTQPLTDDALLTLAQRACFRYYWDLGHPDAGMAIELLPGNPDLVALGASGFGIGALVVGAERGFAPREEIADRLLKIVRFLDRADRFHGAWPHFLDGRTGKTWDYFGKYDNGADLVETAFLVQGLLIARQYFDRDTPAETEVRDTITRLWRGVEWDWFRNGPDGPVLYWHWSPDHAFHIAHPLVGWNETQIVYLLAVASPTHAVPAELYHTGFAGQSPLAVAYRRNHSRTTDGDHYTNGHSYYGHKVEVGCGVGGELFFNQFSFQGFDPRGKRDRYTNYFRNNRAIALVSHAYAVENPAGYEGYGPACWGRSAGINSGGGKAQPRDDNGTICCSASQGVFPFTPEESLAALKHFYRELGPRVWGAYGPHDGFNQTQQWYDEQYMGLNQAQVTVMIENHRTGLPWRCFMANPEVAPALKAIGFEPDPQGDR